ncbi:ubiquinone biosynthesis accessory factor UbiJ [Candidatus Williamhamiltonella defendens]|uniref:ubiquinone biosynthesis accessory factor UbiJ n=1 Tax=Candidatus Williamhamiltonella defendens TaxID=138072 RepID=UPI00130DC864|nr:SCP2 sterol-binding domain-containing protein [Candidatus Hamiltonella defensa]
MMTIFFSSFLERALNSSSLHDKYINVVRSRLSGKVLNLQLGELSFSLSFLFTEHHIDVFTNWSDAAGCTIITRFDTLLKLMKNPETLSLLIREGKIIVEGDIHIIQHSVTLLDIVEWDIAECLSPYFGDLVAETMKQFFCKGHDFVVSHLKRKKRHLSEAITEEWKLIPPSLAVESFKKEVCVISLDFEALNARISRLKKNQ